MNIIVAERIRELMKEHGLNQVRLAEKSRLETEHDKRLAARQEGALHCSLWLLADFFDVDIDYLVGRRDYY